MPEGLYQKYILIDPQTGKEVEDFAFILKPETDRSAAAAAYFYAQHVREAKPTLWSDLVYEITIKTGYTWEDFQSDLAAVQNIVGGT